MADAGFALLVAQGGRSPTGGTSRAKHFSFGCGGGSAAVLHVYTSEEFGITPERVASAFAAYYDYFDDPAAWRLLA